MRKFKLLLPVLLTIAATMTCASRLLSQDINENNITHYSTEQGLSDNSVTGIAQDSAGYIWLSTAFGLNRFNGSSFVQFHSNNDNHSLPAENIKGLVWIDKRRLAAFGDGLHITDTRTGETRNLFIPYKNNQYQYKFNWIMGLSSNAAGDIFVLTRSGFYHFDKDYHLVFRFDYYTDQEVATTSFVFGEFLLSMDEQRLAIISNDGIYYYHSGEKRIKKMDVADCPLLAGLLDYSKKDYKFFQQKPGCFIILKESSDTAIYINLVTNKRKASRLPFPALSSEFDYRSSLFAFNDTLLYITGKVSGFYKIKLSPATGEITLCPKRYLPYYSCRCLMKDRDNNLWVATNEGLIQLVNARRYVQQIPIPSSLHALFPNIAIDDICADSNRIYVATHGNAGILVFDKYQMQFIRRISFEKYVRSPENVYSILAADNNTLFAGCNGPLLRINTATGNATEIKLAQWNRPTDWIADLHLDKQKNLWIAAGRIYKYETATGKSSIVSSDQPMFDRIEWAQSIHEDTSGNIWLAGNGLLRYNIHTNNADQLVDSFPFIKIPDRQVNTFIADNQGNLWINPNNNGLVCYNIEKKTFRHFTRDNGLPADNIASMIVLRNKLWMATFSGVACLDLRTFKITSFGKEDGFPDQPIPICARFFYDAEQNKLYIGFTNTIVQFDPDIIFQQNRAPDLYIESLATNDQKRIIFPGENFTTSWRNNDISLTIGSINFLTSNSQRFAYRIYKDDSTYWQPLGTRNSFSISSLSPGHHRIQVKLSSISHRWPEQVKEFNLEVLPPFWSQTWFAGLSFVLLLLFIYLILKWRTSMIRKKERAKTHMQQLKAEEYKNRFELEQISHYFSSSLAGKKNVDEILWDVSKNLIGRMNYEDCMIYLWSEDKTRMVQKASFGPKGSREAINEKVFDVLPGQGVVGYVMQTKTPLIIADTRKDSRYRLDDIARLSEVCVPIIHNSELIGIIDSEHPVANHFTERDIKILTTIATLVSNKITQIEYEQSLIIKQNEIALINQQLAEAQLSALQTQMNPHFIFNSLNSIKGMILENEQQKASRYMSKFANMLRITLNQSKHVFTTLYENMEHLENYLAMEKLRFDDSFTFRITADEKLDREDTLIPTLMIQPLAENAIWHGLMPWKGKKKLLIHFSCCGERISCTIEDNGIGIRQSEQLKKLNRPLHKSVGLSNLRNRIKIMNEKYNTGCTLEITDLQDLEEGKTGSRAVLSFNQIPDKLYL